MGIYLNPGFANFEEMLKAEIYVDKTMLIAGINRLMDTGEKYICMSRPRRFGKTIASNMLCAYYSKGVDSTELLAPYKIAGDPSFREKMNKYNVIKLDLNSEYQNTKNKLDLIDNITEEVKSEMRQAFPKIVFSEEDTLAKCMLKVYSATGETFVILIDEYDILVREKVDQVLFDSYMSFLNGLFKSDTLRPAISLAYLTGILPIVRDKIQSKLNNFNEYTFLDALSLTEYVGLTSDEVQKVCQKYGMDFDDCRQWYDGYRQGEFEIYNPESVVKSMIAKRYGNYWNRTSTYMAIAERIRMDFDGTRDAVVRMIAGESIPVNVGRFMNTMDSFASRDDIFAYLIHLGYLAYNIDDETCRIPNREVRNEWLNAIADDKDYAVTNKIIEDSRQLLRDTIAGDEESVAVALDTTHIHVTSNRSYNNEDALGSAIYLAYIYALNDYTCVREMTAGKGYADVIYIPVHPGNSDRPAMIMELKKNDCTESALDQIRNKQYFDSLTHYQGRLLFVGINYDEKEKTHTCQIEWFEK